MQWQLPCWWRIRTGGLAGPDVECLSGRKPRIGFGSKISSPGVQCIEESPKDWRAGMFEDSLVESAGRLKTKKWPKIVTFVGEALLVGFLVLLPLLITEALPNGQLNTFLVSPPPPRPPPPPAPPQIQHVQHVGEIVNG